MFQFRFRFLCLIITAHCLALPAWAVDYSLSGFGTLGYALSNKPYSYQRFVSQEGTFRRDSVAGIQLDARFTERLGATVQVLAAPATDSDVKTEASVAWAFLSLRPTNDWLFRAGKQRIPLYLFSQNYNLGVTYPFARLPTEMYSISPSNEFTGLSASKTWETSGGDLTLDGYWGVSDLDVRFWIRDGIPAVQAPGPLFRRIGVEGGGLVLSYRRQENVVRIGIGKVNVDEKNSSNAYPVTYPFVSLFPGIGYYQVNAALPGPGIPTIDKYGYRTFTLGADLDIGSGFRAMGEFARSYVSDTLFSTQSNRGYVAILRPINKWTPYISYAFLRSEASVLLLQKLVNNTSIPVFVPGAAQINAAQRVGADSLLAFDQRSLAIGTSYSLSATSKLKAELMRVRIGQVSSLVDAPPGSNIRNQNINVISLSYSVVF
ncbi:MAG TPA: hypothetical protein PLJ46_01530 [Burkholderiaceae bacterium]|nr:hypothetical protein [Burkholderiaceae bacterium]